MSSSNIPISISSSTTSTRRLAAADPVILLESPIVTAQSTVPAEPTDSDEPRSLSDASMMAPGSSAKQPFRGIKVPSAQRLVVNSPPVVAPRNIAVWQPLFRDHPSNGDRRNGLESRRRKLEAGQRQGQGKVGQADRRRSRYGRRQAGPARGQDSGALWHRQGPGPQGRRRLVRHAEVVTFL